MTMQIYRVVDFSPSFFGGWKNFSNYMHQYYVGSPWFFGYKCPKCEFDNFDVAGNSVNPGTCDICGTDLVSFFSAERTERYFSKINFFGKILLINNRPIGWVLGFEENLHDFNDKLPNQKVFNISYFCFLPELRLSNQGHLERFRRLFGSLLYKNFLLRRVSAAVLLFIGYSPLMVLFEDLSKDIKDKRISLISAKISSDVLHLQKLMRATGFEQVGPWKKDIKKKIWVKKII